MPWIDNQEDYFLHDFSGGPAEKEAGQSNNPDGSDTADSPAVSDSPEKAPRSFSFGNEDAAPTPSPGSPKRHRGRSVLLWFIFTVVLVGGGAFWLRYLNPYTEDTHTTGYITNVEKRGIFFKTYEGEMVSENVALDSSRIYQRDIHFSVPSAELARQLQSYQSSGRKVTLTTEKYYGVLPWRGASNVIVTNVQPAQTSDR